MLVLATFRMPAPQNQPPITVPISTIPSGPFSGQLTLHLLQGQKQGGIGLLKAREVSFHDGLDLIQVHPSRR